LLYYNVAAGSFHTKKLYSRLHSIEIEFYSRNKKSLVEPSVGGLSGKVEKPLVDFLFVILNFFRYLLRLRRYKRKSVEVCVFRNANFRRNGVAHQPLLVS